MDLPPKPRFQSFNHPKKAYINYKLIFFETIRETSLKPIETFYAIFETFESSEVSRKFQLKTVLSLILTTIYKNTLKIVETCKVSREFALNSLYNTILGGIGNIETFKTRGGLNCGFSKTPPKLFKPNSLKVNSLSELYKSTFNKYYIYD